MVQQSWRASISKRSRNRIVSKIMDTLQRHEPLLLGEDAVKELWKIARQVEERSFYAADDCHGYLIKISLRMLNFEKRKQNATSSTLAAGSSGTTQGPVRPLVDAGVPGDSLQQLSQTGGIDQADTVWAKRQMLKEKYLQDVKDLYSMLASKNQQHMPQELLQKLTHYKTVLERIIQYLMAPKGSLPKEFKQDEVEDFEKEIVRIMNTFKRYKRRQQQQGNLGPSSAGQQHQQATHILRPNDEPLQPQQQGDMASSG